MGKPAARVGDFHMCPMVTPGTPPIPHIGGPIMPPGAPTVMIGGMPAATMGNMCTCTGPPDTIILGSVGVMIGGKPAARMGDQCAHGGAIMAGCPTVLIGETGAGGGGMAAMPVNVLIEMQNSVPPSQKSVITRVIALKEAAGNGMPFVQGPGICPECGKEHYPETLPATGDNVALADPPREGPVTPTATITSQTIAKSPSERTRTKIGVGEEVKLTFSLGEASWSLAGGGDLSSTNGNQITFTAGDSAESATITGVGGGASASITFTVVAPSSWHMYKKSGTDIQHTNGIPDNGFYSTVYLHPNDVNFYRVEVREKDSQAVSTGSWNLDGNKNQWHGGYAAPDRVSAWLPANNHTDKYGTSIGGHDHVYSGYPFPLANVGTAPPFVVGTKVYAITWQWHVIGKRTVSNLPRTKQHHNITAAGVCHSSKAGYSSHSLYSDPTS